MIKMISHTMKSIFHFTSLNKLSDNELDGVALLNDLFFNNCLSYLTLSNSTGDLNNINNIRIFNYN
jgi:hypothetical protein